MRILLVEDDVRFRETLARGLREHSYAVDVVGDGRAALDLAAGRDFDAIVLDVMLPMVDGIAVCERLRRAGSHAPVLMLTARDSVRDKIAGLDAGADDYLTKPFDFHELLARLRALQRRQARVLPAEIRVADLYVDTRSQTVRRGGREVALTAKEYAVLEFLARNAGRVLRRAEIHGHVWDDQHDPSSNSLEVYVARLRRKVDKPDDRPLIHTRRGVGYFLADPAAIRSENADASVD
jgi:two-component system copper resistance phosphate regulon response regulator CusR